MHLPSPFRRLCCLFALIGLLPSATEAAEPGKPNIVFIFADDLGWQDTGFAGGEYVETPHLDRLAQQGMVFPNAYSAAGNCAPSRGCLISGQYTPRHHVYAVGSTNRGPKSHMRMIPIPNRLYLPAETVTMGEAMKSAGYATGLFGKQHLTGNGKTKAEEAGFDVVKVSWHGLNSDDPKDPKGIFSITSAACEFIEANRDRPFFAYLPHYAVHTRIEARQETLARFKKKQPGEEHDDPLFASCIADLDAGIGILMAKLDELGLTDNTLVVFTSDNGGTGWSQEPLRGKKGCYYEGGIRVPMLARWPGVIEPGSKCMEPVINVDMYPTFLAAAGASIPETLDGESLVPLYQGEPSLKRAGIFWHFPGYLDRPVPRGRDKVFRTTPVTVIRSGDWKLHLYHEEWQLDGGREKLETNHAVELYNLVDDPGERENLANSDPKKRDELLDVVLSWIDSSGALLPTEKNPKYDPKTKVSVRYE